MMANPVRLDPAERAVLDQVKAWRRLRMNWQAVGRSLGMAGEAARAKYETLIAYEPSIAPRAPVAMRRPVVAPVEAAPAAVKAKRVRPEVKAPGSKPRVAKIVAAPFTPSEALEAAAFEAACRVLGLDEAEAGPKGGGRHRARVLAAAGVALWSWGCKKSVAKAFGLHGTMLAPSGMAVRRLTEAMVVEVRAALWAAGLKP